MNEQYRPLPFDVKMNKPVPDLSPLDQGSEG